MSRNEPFHFYTERRLVALTGLKARNLEELLACLEEVSGSSIFYHMHHRYLAHHFEKPVFHNDFALWTSRALMEERLAEQLAVIDLFEFGSIRQLRESIISIVKSYLAEVQGRSRQCLPGDEFHFCESKSFIMRTGLVAVDVPDFFAKLPQVSTGSLFFHLFESRLRLGPQNNDFSSWLKARREETLAERIHHLNPYTRTLPELKAEIVRLWQSREIAE